MASTRDNIIAELKTRAGVTPSTSQSVLAKDLVTYLEEHKTALDFEVANFVDDAKVGSPGAPEVKAATDHLLQVFGTSSGITADAIANVMAVTPKPALPATGSTPPAYYIRIIQQTLSAVDVKKEEGEVVRLRGELKVLEGKAYDESKGVDDAAINAQTSEYGVEVRRLHGDFMARVNELVPLAAEAKRRHDAVSAAKGYLGVWTPPDDVTRNYNEAKRQFEEKKAQIDTARQARDHYLEAKRVEYRTKRSEVRAAEVALAERLKPATAPISRYLRHVVEITLSSDSKRSGDEVKIESAPLPSASYIHLFDKLPDHLQTTIFEPLVAVPPGLSGGAEREAKARVAGVKKLLALVPAQLCTGIKLPVTPPDVAPTPEVLFGQLRDNCKNQVSAIPRIQEYAKILVANMIAQLKKEDLNISDDAVFNLYQAELNQCFKDEYGITAQSALDKGAAANEEKTRVDEEVKKSVAEAKLAVAPVLTPIPNPVPVYNAGAKIKQSVFDHILTDLKAPHIAELFVGASKDLTFGLKDSKPAPQAKDWKDYTSDEKAQFDKVVYALDCRMTLEGIKAALDYCNDPFSFKCLHITAPARLTLLADHIFEQNFQKFYTNKINDLFAIMQLRYPGIELKEEDVKAKLKISSRKDTVDVDAIITKLKTESYRTQEEIRKDLDALGLSCPGDARLSVRVKIDDEVKVEAELKAVQTEADKLVLPADVAPLDDELLPLVQQKEREFKEAFSSHNKDKCQEYKDAWINQFSHVLKEVETELKLVQVEKGKLEAYKATLTDLADVTHVSSAAPSPALRANLSVSQLVKYVRTTATATGGGITDTHVQDAKKAEIAVEQKHKEIKQLEQEIKMTREKGKEARDRYNPKCERYRKNLMGKEEKESHLLAEATLDTANIELAALRRKITIAEGELVTLQRDLKVKRAPLEKHYKAIEKLQSMSDDIEGKADKLKEKEKALVEIRSHLKEMQTAFNDGVRAEAKGTIAVEFKGAVIHYSESKEYADAKEYTKILSDARGGVGAGTGLMAGAVAGGKKDLMVSGSKATLGIVGYTRPVTVEGAVGTVDSVSTLIVGEHLGGARGAALVTPEDKVYNKYNQKQAAVDAIMHSLTDPKVQAAFDKLTTPTPPPATPLTLPEKESKLKAFVAKSFPPGKLITQGALVAALSAEGVVDAKDVGKIMMDYINNRFFEPGTNNTVYSAEFATECLANMKVAAQNRSSSAGSFIIVGDDPIVKTGWLAAAIVLSRTLGLDDYKVDDSIKDSCIPPKAREALVKQYLMAGECGEFGKEVAKGLEPPHHPGNSVAYLKAVKDKIEERKLAANTVAVVAGVGGYTRRRMGSST